ncbi:tyrosine-protein phosphatase [Lacrimispora sp.]|uniref:tyrosine-protein phosphatase n=1 Tax=Lacrimispora sp. TaxID=2719234 RepID=UPI0028A5B95D|nr:hypothetical protein [Lacrimispora sp.]
MKTGEGCHEYKVDRNTEYAEAGMLCDCKRTGRKIGSKYIRAAFEEVDSLGGMEAYLDRVIGFYEADRMRLKEIYLE